MSQSRDLCPICGEGHLQSQVGQNSVEYKGQTASLDLHFSLCNGCGSEQAGADQLRANKRIMMAFKKQVDSLLTGAEVRKIRGRLGLSQIEASRVFGGGPVAFSKYENDDVAQSSSMDKLLRLAADLPSASARLLFLAGIEDSAAESQWKSVIGLRARSFYSVKTKSPGLRVVSTSSQSMEYLARYVA